MKRVVVDSALCEGSQLCVGLRPDVFAFGDDGCAYVIDAEWPEHANPTKIDDVITLCPADAIHVTDS